MDFKIAITEAEVITEVRNSLSKRLLERFNEYGDEYRRIREAVFKEIVTDLSKKWLAENEQKVLSEIDFKAVVNNVSLKAATQSYVDIKRNHLD